MSTIKSSAESLTINADGNGNDIKFQSNGSEVAQIDQAGNLTLSGTVDGVDIQTLNTTASAALPKAGGTLTGDLNFGDNVDANFGAGADLKIYHDGSHSRIKDVGTGNLYITGSTQVNIQDDDGEPMINCVKDGAVNVMHNGLTKFSTTATGVAVTGAVTADSSLIRGAVVQVQGVHRTPSSAITSAGSLSELSSTLRIAFTPKHASSKLIHEFYAPYNFPNSTHLQWAYFRNYTDSAIELGSASAGSRKSTHWGARTSQSDANDFDNLSMRMYQTANNTNARTYTIFHGTEGATASFGVSPLSSGSGATWPLVYTITEIYNP